MQPDFLPSDRVSTHFDLYAPFCLAYKRHSKIMICFKRSRLPSTKIALLETYKPLYKSSPCSSIPILHTAAFSMVKNFGDDEQRAHDPSAHEQRMDSEKHVQRNPHPDFAKVQASRPDWHTDRGWTITKTKEPNWKLGQGGNDGGESLKKNHVEINPYEEGRPAVSNYKLLISGIIPRPIGFLSTRSKDGTGCEEHASLSPLMVC